MNVQLIRKKIEERLNKLSSQDYGNIEPWMIVEAFNKAQIEWVRRQLQGINQTRTGAEGSIRRIDDLQFILTPLPIIMTDKGLYWEGDKPDDYMEWCRISANAFNSCCPARPLVIFEQKEADKDMLLANQGKQPNFEWATTFATMLSNTIRIYTNDIFDIQDTVLTYYRMPVNIQIAGVFDPYTQAESLSDMESEAPEDVQEILIDDAAKVLAGDIDNWSQAQRLEQTTNNNT